MKTSAAIFASILLNPISFSVAADPAPPTEKTFEAPHGMKVSVKMVGPYGQDTDLQMICAFRHKPNGDTYLSAMKDFNDKVGGLLSSLRDRGDFVGELGETILFIPPAGTITPKRILVIGLGDEANLSLDTLRVVGRAAAREAVRLKAKNVSWAPVLRDQGNNQLEVGDGDRAFIEAMLGAYDTEIRLQEQKLAERFTIDQWTVEAGPSFFDSASGKVASGIEEARARIGARTETTFTTAP